MSELKTNIKRIFNLLLEDKTSSLANITELIDEQYIQIVNSKVLTYTDFIEHIIALRRKVKSCSIFYETLLEEGEKVFSKHIATTVLKDGNIVTTKVFAEFTFSDGKLIRCDEVTQLIDGDKEYENLGSIS